MPVPPVRFVPTVLVLTSAPLAKMFVVGFVKISKPILLIVELVEMLVPRVKSAVLGFVLQIVLEQRQIIVEQPVLTNKLIPLTVGLVVQLVLPGRPVRLVSVAADRMKLTPVGVIPVSTAAVMTVMGMAR